MESEIDATLPPTDATHEGTGAVTIAAFQRANVARCNAVFRPLFDSPPSFYAMALAGEVGELCNKLKKQADGADVPIAEIESEFGDVLPYLVLLAERCAVDLEAVTVRKFNEVSAKKGYAIRLAPKPIHGDASVAWAAEAGNLWDRWSNAPEGEVEQARAAIGDLLARLTVAAREQARLEGASAPQSDQPQGQRRDLRVVRTAEEDEVRRADALSELQRIASDDSDPDAAAHAREHLKNIEAHETSTPARSHHLAWTGVEWTDDRCGCRYHPDDDNGSHGGAPHVHRCEKHSAPPPDGTTEQWNATVRDAVADLRAREPNDGSALVMRVGADGLLRSHLELPSDGQHTDYGRGCRVTATRALAMLRTRPGDLEGALSLAAGEDGPMPTRETWQDDAALVRRAVDACRGRHGRMARAFHLHYVFGLGSGFSRKLCERLGLDPDEVVGHEVEPGQGEEHDEDDEQDPPGSSEIGMLPEPEKAGYMAPEHAGSDLAADLREAATLLDEEGTSEDSESAARRLRAHAARLDRASIEPPALPDGVDVLADMIDRVIWASSEMEARARAALTALTSRLDRATHDLLLARSQALLHPNGACSCGGEGRCSWCLETQTRIDAGAPTEPTEPPAYMAPEQLQVLATESGQNRPQDPSEAARPPAETPLEPRPAADSASDHIGPEAPVFAPGLELAPGNVADLTAPPEPMDPTAPSPGPAVEVRIGVAEPPDREAEHALVRGRLRGDGSGVGAGPVVKVDDAGGMVGVWLDGKDEPAPAVDPTEAEHEARRTAWVRIGCQGGFDDGWSAGVAWGRSGQPRPQARDRADGAPKANVTVVRIEGRDHRILVPLGGIEYWMPVADARALELGLSLAIDKAEHDVVDRDASGDAS
jgi:NTP pyrophosphatase (non-canonical NTP hydrolase)